MTNNVGKTSHIEIVQNPDVVEFLKSCTFMREPTGEEIEEIVNSFNSISGFENEKLPENLITINSSSYEAHVREDIPYTNIGFVKLVSTLLKNNEFLKLKETKFVDPFQVASLMDKKETISFVLPSSNVRYGDCETTVESFRKAMEDFFDKTRENEDRQTSLKSTLFWLASYADNNDINKIWALNHYLYSPIKRTSPDVLSFITLVKGLSNLNSTGSGGRAEVSPAIIPVTAAASVPFSSTFI